MTTYYVDNSSSTASDRNAGTSAYAPLLGLAGVNKLELKPGDVVAFKAGTSYSASVAGDGALIITHSGTASSHITFTSYGEGEKPIINNTSSAKYSDSIVTKGASHIDLSGLQFTQASRAAVHVDAASSHVTVQNSEMTNVGFGVMLEGSGNIVTQNYVHDLHMVHNTPSSVNSDDDYGASGVLVAGSNNEISYNRIVNAKAPSYDYGYDGGGIELFGKVSNVSIHHNWVEGSVGFLEAGGFGGSVENISIINNTSLNNGNFVVLHNGGGQFGQSYSNVLADHNTIVNQFNTMSEMATVFLDSPAAAGSFSFTNNIVSLNNGQSVFKQDGNYHSNNLFDLQSSTTHLYTNWGMTLGRGETYGSPNFTNLAAHDLTATSAASKSFGATFAAVDLAKLPLASVYVASLDVAPVIATMTQKIVHGTSVAATSIFLVSDANGDAITQYQVAIKSPTADSGHFVLSGVIQEVAKTLTLSAADFAKLNFVSGFTSDEIQVRASDGQLWSGWAATNVSGTNAAPVVTTVATQTLGRNATVSAASLFSVRDTDGDAMIKYQLTDKSSGSLTGSLLLGGVAQAFGTAVEVSAAQLKDLTFKAGVGYDTIQIRAFDGHDWSAWGTAGIAGVNAAPIIAASTQTVAHHSTTALSQVLSATDANGDSIQRYQITDLNSATNSGVLLLDGVVQQAGTTVELTAAQLSSLKFAAGSGSDMLQVRAFDGLDWSAPVKFTVTAPVNAAPVVTAGNITVARGTVLAQPSLFSVKDAEGDAITKYQVIDYGTAAASGTFLLNGVAQQAGTAIELTAAQLSTLAFKAALGNDTLSIRAFDGTDWSAWTSLVAKGTNDAPVITAPPTTLAHNAWTAASTLFATKDADGDGVTHYQLADLTSNGESGSFVLNGVVQMTGQTIDIAAADLQNLLFRAGSGSDQIRVRAFDGTDWGAWTTTTVTAPVDGAAVVMATNIAVERGTTVGMRGLFTVSDVEGDAVTKYQVIDYAAAVTSGHVVANGAVLAANTTLELTAAQLAHATYVTGTTADSIAVRAFDGIRWGAWTTVQINPTTTAANAAVRLDTALPGAAAAIANSAPTLTPHDQSVGHGAVVAASGLFGAADIDGDAVTTYQLRILSPTEHSGFFAVGGATYASGEIVEINAGQLAQTVFHAGSSNNTLEVRASDSMSWSAWTDVSVAVPMNHAPTVSVINPPMALGSYAAMAPLISVQDADGDDVTRYQIVDRKPGSGHLLLAGVEVGANTTLDLTPAQISKLFFQSGSVTDTIQVRAYDGFDWSKWTDMHLPVSANHAPVVRDSTTVELAHGATVSAASLLAVSDADGDVITSYRFADLAGAANSGRFIVNGTVLQAGQYVTLTADELERATFVGGSGVDKIAVSASDGADWSGWATVTVSSPINHAPVAASRPATLTHDATVKAVSLFTFSDADGDPIQKYQIVDRSPNAASGHFVLNGQDVAANATLELSAADMAALLFKVGSTAADYMQVRAFDGMDWSAWQAQTVTPKNDPAVVASTGVAAAQHGTVSAASLFTVTDPNNDVITRYQIVDWTTKAGSGFFAVDDVAQAAGQVIELTAQQFAHTTFHGSTYATGDDVALRVFDGQAFSDWVLGHV